MVTTTVENSCTKSNLISSRAVALSPLDYNSSNYAAGNGGSLPELIVGSTINLPSVGTGLIKLKDGSFMGIVNPSIDESSFSIIDQTLNISQLNAYFYVLNPNGEIVQTSFPSREYANDFSSLTQLSSGKILILGLNGNFNEENRLTILTYE